MAGNQKGWRWLAVVCVLLAVAYFWRDFKHGDKGEGLANKVAVERTGAGNGRSPTPPRTLLTRPAITLDGTAAVPVQLQLPNVGRVRTARSYQEWLVQFPSNDRPVIEAFNKAHFGIYRVNSREQVAWMAANGYPMPEDILAAEKLSDRDLLKLAERGNSKAAFLLAENQNKKLVNFLAEGGRRAALYQGVDGEIRLKQEMIIENLLKQSTSPYKGYIQASEARSGLYAGQGQDVVDVRVIAGLIWAQELGDFRAGQFLRDYVGQDSRRMTIFDAANVVSLNAEESMAFMARTGGQRPVAAGGGIPGGFEPVQ